MAGSFLYRPKKVGDKVSPKNVHESSGIMWESRLFAVKDIDLAMEEGWQDDMASPNHESLSAKPAKATQSTEYDIPGHDHSKDRKRKPGRPKR